MISVVVVLSTLKTISWNMITDIRSKKSVALMLIKA
jgi:hypothetical protein